MWVGEPTLQPRAWINNFEPDDRFLAACLLERFVFYDKRLTDTLLAASFFSLGDGLPKGPATLDRHTLLSALSRCYFTPVRGESPNPTDSGNSICRRARQLLGVPEARTVEFGEALEKANQGFPIVFLDDFIGSGDQFLSTWKMVQNGTSFESINFRNNFCAIYISLVATDFGLNNIYGGAPSVAVSVAHTIDARGTFAGIQNQNPALWTQLDGFLRKYSARLSPADDYMLQDEFIIYGYRHRGLFLGFEHSIPDATLPIFWCKGDNNWEPLIERT